MKASVGRTLGTVALAGLLVALGAAAGLAAPGGPPAGRSRSMEGAGPPPSDEEMREAMQQLMIVRMKRALRLTPRQEPEVVPRVQALLDARREDAKRRRLAMMKLRVLLMDDSADEASITKALREVETLERESHERQTALRAAIDAGLTPRQRGRLLFFEAHFRRAMQRRLQEAAGRALGPEPPPGPGGRGLYGPGPAPPDDSFDDLEPPDEEE